MSIPSIPNKTMPFGIVNNPAQKNNTDVKQTEQLSTEPAEVKGPSIDPLPSSVRFGSHDELDEAQIGRLNEILDTPFEFFGIELTPREFLEGMLGEDAFRKQVLYSAFKGSVTHYILFGGEKEFSDIDFIFVGNNRSYLNDFIVVFEKFLRNKFKDEEKIQKILLKVVMNKNHVGFASSEFDCSFINEEDYDYFFRRDCLFIDVNKMEVCWPKTEGKYEDIVDDIKKRRLNRSTLQDFDLKKSCHALMQLSRGYRFGSNEALKNEFWSKWQSILTKCSKKEFVENIDFILENKLDIDLQLPKSKLSQRRRERLVFLLNVCFAVNDTVPVEWVSILQDKINIERRSPSIMQDEDNNLIQEIARNIGLCEQTRRRNFIGAYHLSLALLPGMGEAYNEVSLLVDHPFNISEDNPIPRNTLTGFFPWLRYLPGHQESENSLTQTSLDWEGVFSGLYHKVSGEKARLLALRLFWYAKLIEVPPSPWLLEQWRIYNNSYYTLLEEAFFHGEELSVSNIEKASLALHLIGLPNRKDLLKHKDRLKTFLEAGSSSEDLLDAVELILDSRLDLDPQLPEVHLIRRRRRLDFLLNVCFVINDPAHEELLDIFKEKIIVECKGLPKQKGNNNLFTQVTENIVYCEGLGQTRAIIDFFHLSLVLLPGMKEICEEVSLLLLFEKPLRISEDNFYLNLWFGRTKKSRKILTNAFPWLGPTPEQKESDQLPSKPFQHWEKAFSEPFSTFSNKKARSLALKLYSFAHVYGTMPPDWLAQQLKTCNDIYYSSQMEAFFRGKKVTVSGREKASFAHYLIGHADGQRILEHNKRFNALLGSFKFPKLNYYSALQTRLVRNDMLEQGLLHWRKIPDFLQSVSDSQPEKLGRVERKAIVSLAKSYCEQMRSEDRERISSPLFLIFEQCWNSQQPTVEDMQGFQEVVSALPSNNISLPDALISHIANFLSSFETTPSTQSENSSDKAIVPVLSRLLEMLPSSATLDIPDRVKYTNSLVDIYEQLVQEEVLDSELQEKVIVRLKPIAHNPVEAFAHCRDALLSGPHFLCIQRLPELYNHFGVVGEVQVMTNQAQKTLDGKDLDALMWLMQSNDYVSYIAHEEIFRVFVEEELSDDLCISLGDFLKGRSLQEPGHYEVALYTKVAEQASSGSAVELSEKYFKERSEEKGPLTEDEKRFYCRACEAFVEENNDEALLQFTSSSYVRAQEALSSNDQLRKTLQNRARSLLSFTFSAGVSPGHFAGFLDALGGAEGLPIHIVSRLLFTLQRMKPTNYVDRAYTLLRPNTMGGLKKAESDLHEISKKVQQQHRSQALRTLFLWAKENKDNAFCSVIIKEFLKTKTKEQTKQVEILFSELAQQSSFLAVEAQLVLDSLCYLQDANSLASVSRVTINRRALLSAF